MPLHSKKLMNDNQIPSTSLVLRDVTKEDAQLLFNWANEAGVRNNSLQQETIIWEDHQNWLYNHLDDPNCRMFILESGGTSLGQLRIYFSDDYWNINYSIDSNFRGKGLGREIIKILLEKFDSYKFKAIVKKHNEASVKIFFSLGFKKITSVSEDLEYYEFEFNA